MSDDSHSLTTADGSAGMISHRRILILMAGVLGAGAIAGFAFVSARTGFGVLIGGVLAYANYFWQKHSLKAIFDRAVHGKKARFLALRYILRYVVLGAALTVIYFTESVSIFAVIFGLSSFAFAVVIEGFTTMFSSKFNKVS